MTGSAPPNGHGHVEQEVRRLLDLAPAFRRLDPAAQLGLRGDLVKIATYMAAPATALDRPYASQMAPDLRAQLAPRQPDATRPPLPVAGTVPSTAAPAPQAGAVTRAGEVSRATLNAIDFPQFVSSLIQGTFQAIVDATSSRWRPTPRCSRTSRRRSTASWSTTSRTACARDYLADQYGGVLARDTSAGRARLVVNPDVPNGELPSFFKDLGFETPDDLDEETLERDVVPAARRYLAEQRQQTLATMVLMGINRVLVEDGEITAKLQFHIDASETTKIKFDETKTTTGTMAGRAGRNPFSANAVMVNTSSLNAQSDLNVRADLTGQVKVKFRSEAFPLERFADSAAIQLINQNAKVPAPQPAAAPAPAAAAPGPAAATPPATSPSAPAAQSLGDSDPWAPRS